MISGCFFFAARKVRGHSFRFDRESDKFNDILYQYACAQSADTRFPSPIRPRIGIWCHVHSQGDVSRCARWTPMIQKHSIGAITSKIKHAIKLKTSLARLVQLLQSSLAFYFSLQPMAAYRAGLDGTPSLAGS